MGAEAIKQLLQRVDLEAECEELKEQLKTATGQKAYTCYSYVWTFWMHSVLLVIKPEWMVMDVVPVIPPDIRPMVQLERWTFPNSDLNDYTVV